MMGRLHKKAMNTLLAAMLAAQVVLAPAAVAEEVRDDYGLAPSEAMFIDGVIVRPVSLVGTALGVVAFVVTLPFTLPTGQADEAGRKLVAEPAKYTFARPLGEFD